MNLLFSFSFRFTLALFTSVSITAWGAPHSFTISKKEIHSTNKLESAFSCRHKTQNHHIVFVNQNNTKLMHVNNHEGGALVKLGEGKLILTGHNHYSEGIVVERGILEGDTASLQGNIHNHGVLIFDQHSDGIFHSNIEGNGILIKQGGASIVMHGNIQELRTHILSGNLTVNGNLNSLVIVQPQASLKGNGSVIGDVINHGSVMPGNSVGKLLIQGNYMQFPESTLVAEMDPHTASQLNVTGRAHLDGSLEMIPLHGAYFPNTYNILHAEDGFSGKFSLQAPLLPLLSFDLEFRHRDVNLILSSKIHRFLKNENAKAAAKCFGKLHFSKDLDAQKIFKEFTHFNHTQLNNAFDQIQPSLYSALALTQERNLILARSAYSRHFEILHLDCSEIPDEFTIWADAIGQWRDQETHSDCVGYETMTGGAAIGLDYQLTQNAYLGAAATYTYAKIDWDKHRGHGNITSYYGGIYGTWFNSNFFVDFCALGGWSRYFTERHLRFANIDREAHNHHEGYDADVHIGLGYRMFLSTTEFQPFVETDYVFVHQNRFTEKNANSLNLKMKHKDTNFLRSQAGLRIYHSFACLCDTDTLIGKLSLSYINDVLLNHNHYTAQFKHASCQFTVEGENPYRHLFSPEVGFIFFSASETLAISILYNGEFGKHYQLNEGSFQLDWNF